MRTVNINDTNVIEHIRTVMKIATLDTKGLMSPTYFNVFNRKTIVLNPGSSVVLGKVNGLLVVSNQYIADGKPALYICGLSGIEKIAGQNFDLVFSIDKGILTIKSNYESVGTFYIACQNIMY